MRLLSYVQATRNPDSDLKGLAKHPKGIRQPQDYLFNHNKLHSRTSGRLRFSQMHLGKPLHYRENNIYRERELTLSNNMIIKTYQESGNLSPSRGLARADYWPSSILKMCHPSISEKLPQILSFARNFKFTKQKKRKSDILKTE